MTKGDWSPYEERCARGRLEWPRSLGPDEAVSLFEDFHRFAASFEVNAACAERLERARWMETLSIRRRRVELPSRLARARCGRRDSTATAIWRRGSANRPFTSGTLRLDRRLDVETPFSSVTSVTSFHHKSLWRF